MKKHILLVVLLFLSITVTNACEICGCSHSNFQIGLLPKFNKGFVGIRYSYARFNSHVKDEAGEFSHDYYQTAELWGGYSFKKIQVMAFAPYIFSRKESDDGVTKAKGIGDLMMLVNYKIFSAASLREGSSVKHDLLLGGGIKLPTGVNQVDTSDPEFNIGDFNSQAGTGSVDYILNATHNLSWKKNGIVTNVAYRINTENDQEYKFGNRAYVNTSYYYTITKGTAAIIPNAGLNYQRNSVNTFEGKHVEDSNGYTLNSTVGINLLYDKMGINAMASIPVAQNNFDGQTKLKGNLLVGVTYSF